MVSWLVLLPLACALLEEQRVDPVEVNWAGVVLADLPSEGATEELTDGNVEFLDEDGEPLVLSDGSAATATQPWPDSPGWWQVRVPVDVEVTVRVAGAEDADPALATMVWRGRTPTGRAYWMQGALFTRELGWLDDFLASVSATLPGTEVVPLADGAVAHLWGEPLDPEAWAGADIAVVDGEGAEATVLRYAVEDDGTLVEATDRVDLFLAVNLAPGPVTLSVTAADGRAFSTTWPARGGDLLSAIYAALPAE